MTQDHAGRTPAFEKAARELLAAALGYARSGMHVFPIVPYSKEPLVKFGTEATTDEETIRAWWKKWPHANIGLACTPSNMCVLDVDTKEGKKGIASLNELEQLDGKLPRTLRSRTASGGGHLFMRGQARSSIGKLGDGLDLKSDSNQYVLLPPSLVLYLNPKRWGKYTWAVGDLATSAAPDLPAWFKDECTRVARAKSGDAQDQTPLVEWDLDRNIELARKWVRDHAPVSEQGDGGGEVLVKRVAPVLKDFAVSIATAMELLLEESDEAESWNDRCSPPWSTDPDADKADSLHVKVCNGYRYCRNFPPGVRVAPPSTEKVAADFPQEAEEEFDGPRGSNPDVPVWIAQMNERYFVAEIKGTPLVFEERQPDDSFGDEEEQTQLVIRTKQMLFDKEIKTQLVGEKPVQEGRGWFNSDHRRAYRDFVFEPFELGCDPRDYNAWRGFRVEPGEFNWPVISEWVDLLSGKHAASREYILNWLARLVQRPWEPGETALAFRGRKGTGKTTIHLLFRALLGQHAKKITSREHLIGRFNDHLMDTVALVVDEACWPGDKEGEGVLKSLITDEDLMFEIKNGPKGMMRNRLHVVFASNESWVVPAGAADERRFAVFDVSDARKGDRVFFGRLRAAFAGEELRGFLLHLLGRDLRGYVPANVPQTEALREQREEGLAVEAQWWMDALEEGELPGAIADGVNASAKVADWRVGPAHADKDRLHEAYLTFAKARHVFRPLPKTWLSRFLTKVGVKSTQLRGNRGGERMRGIFVYEAPALGDARKAFDAMLGQERKWPE